MIVVVLPAVDREMPVVGWIPGCELASVTGLFDQTFVGKASFSEVEKVTVEMFSLASANVDEKRRTAQKEHFREGKQKSINTFHTMILKSAIKNSHLSESSVQFIQLRRRKKAQQVH